MGAACASKGTDPELTPQQSAFTSDPNIKRPPYPRVLIIQNDVICPPATAIAALTEHEIPYQVIYAFHEKAFNNIEPTMYEALIVLGGRATVYEKNIDPWLQAEADFIKTALVNDIPILGICLGCQLLAEACGGKVIPGKKGREVGYKQWRFREKEEKNAFNKNYDSYNNVDDESQSNGSKRGRSKTRNKNNTTDDNNEFDNNPVLEHNVKYDFSFGGGGIVDVNTNASTMVQAGSTEPTITTTTTDTKSTKSKSPDKTNTNNSNSGENERENSVSHSRSISRSRSATTLAAIRAAYTSQDDPFLYAIREKNLDKFVVLFHGDTFRLPKTYQSISGQKKVTMLATTNMYPTLFRAGANSYGFQGHPELTPDLLFVWCRGWGDEWMNLVKENTNIERDVIQYSQNNKDTIIYGSKLLFNIWVDIAIIDECDINDEEEYEKYVKSHYGISRLNTYYSTDNNDNTNRNNTNSNNNNETEFAQQRNRKNSNIVGPTWNTKQPSDIQTVKL